MTQTGLESYGRPDVEAADAEILALALEAAELAGAGPLKVRLGDARLFDSALAALALPDLWLRRMRRGLARGRALETIVNGNGGGALAQAGVLAAIESADHAGAKALVEDLLAIAGIDGGRRPQRRRNRRSLSRAGRGALAGRCQRRTTGCFASAFSPFPATPTRPRDSSGNWRRTHASILAEALDSFDQRTGFLAARGLRIEEFTFSAAFVRDLDYYTGFVFEAVDAARPDAKPAVGGGRYDGLARRLGAASDVPAVGAAVWIDRLPISGECP